MARYYGLNPKDQILIYDFAMRWKEDCLINDGSILWPNEKIWIKENFEEFKKCFIDNPDTSNDSFEIKFQKQLNEATVDITKLACELIFIYFIFPSNINTNTKTGLINRIASWKNLVIPEKYFSALIKNKGIGSTGTSFSTRRPYEIAYLANIGYELKSFDKEKRLSLLNDHQAFRSFIDKIRQDKNFALRNIILHLLYPDEYERSSSYSNKLKMYKAFKNRTPELVLPEDVDDALLLIRDHYENKYPGQELDFYEKPLSQYWKVEDIYLKTAFQNWMRNQKKSNGEQYKEGTVTAYTNALKNATSKLNLGDAVQTDLFCYSSFETFEEVHQIIINAPNFEKVDLAAGNKAYSNGMVLYAKFLKEMDEPACWIFQGDSKYCDVIEAVNELDEMMWAVNQYPKQIKSGDKVYIWLSGTGGGIIAAGTIMNDPELRDPDLDDPCNSSETLKLEPFLAVDIKLERKLTTGIVSGTILLADERTKHLDILTHPGATNFPVSKEQDAVIESIINGTYVRIPATYAIPNLATDKKRYWMYAPGEGSKMWEEFHQNSIMGIEWDELGDLTKYPTKEAMKEKMKELYGEDYSYKNAGHATWQFANELKIGDIVFVKKGLKKVVGRGVVTSEYRFDGARSEYRHIHSVNWTHKGEWDHDGQIVLKTLTDITPYTDYYKRLEDMFAAATDGGLLPDDETAQYESYTQEDFLSEVYLSEERYNTLKNLLLKKKNLILQGAPGVGKTYAAERLAFSIMGKKDSSRVRIVQFHQSYSYEDFVMGYRPDENGFKLARGPFYTFCKDAEPDDREYFFIIDEINRGNLSKILGELLMLIENDKRGKEVRLLYSDEQFSVPENVYIIGMMNTADRSLAMIDYALRRRFAFFEFDPAFETEGFKSHQASIANRKFDNLVEAVAAMNRAIAEDASLGSGFQVGHSYFCTCDIVGDDWLSDLVEYELLPLIKEYWFDEPSKVEQWGQRLHGAIHD